MTIICATRFTEESQKAVASAGALAKKNRQILWLVHVLPTGLTRAFQQQSADAAKAALDADCELLRKDGVQVMPALLHGSFPETLAAFCAQKGGQLVVVGDTARTVRTLTAATLDKLAYVLEAPLWVVRDDRPFRSWVTGEKKLRVMLALDETASAAVARDWVNQLSNFGPLDVVAANIWWPLQEYERRSIPVPPAEEGHAALTKTIRAEMEASLAGPPKSMTRRLRLEMGKGHVAEHLMAIAVEEQVDLLLLGTHRRRALGRLFSVSHECLLQSPMSVACVPMGSAVADVGAARPFSTALAVTDFSEVGNRAVSTAIASMGGKGVLHVAYVTADKLKDEERRSLQVRLLDVVPKESLNSVKVQVHVMQGADPGEILSAAGQSLNADVVCVGAGLYAPALAERVNRPLLIVPQKPY